MTQHMQATYTISYMKTERKDRIMAKKVNAKAAKGKGKVNAMSVSKKENGKKGRKGRRGQKKKATIRLGLGLGDRGRRGHRRGGRKRGRGGRKRGRGGKKQQKQIKVKLKPATAGTPQLQALLPSTYHAADPSATGFNRKGFQLNTVLLYYHAARF